ncbi:O-antigen ligase family protein [Streptomyces sp. KR80]|uniref:O-antigen ligase family protein n=1 Tax=Streptomyces sp. KR80 TaxID=3457426 RepID=UPI003FD5AF6A
MAARPAVRDRRSTADGIGVLVLGCCAAWALFTAAGHDARPEGMLLALLAVAAGYACGRIGGAVLPVAAPATAAIAGLALVIATPDDVSGAAVDPTPGHTAASAAQFALAAGAACCAAWAARPPAARTCLRLLAGGIAVAAAVLGSVAGCIAASAVLLCSLATARARHRFPALAALACVAAVIAGGSWAVAEGVLPKGLTASLDGQLTEHRVRLWQDAIGLAERHPVTGAGPDRFADLSPTAQALAEADSTPHSAVLQQAAEQGLPGVLLLGTAFVWVLSALWRSPRPTEVVLTAAAALTTVAALACVGNALSFAQVTAGAGILAGLATARPFAEDPGHPSLTPATATALHEGPADGGSGGWREPMA